MKCGTRDSD